VDVRSKPTGVAPTLRFRLPRSAYLAVLFLLIGVYPLALGSEYGGPVSWTWRAVLLIIPVLAVVFIARTATFVGPPGVRVRAAFGSRTFGWNDIRGLSVNDRSVYAVLKDGAIRLPCVRISDLTAIAKVSGDRLPKLADPVPKYAPSRRSRRRR
jgi:hypothetical protein